MNIHLLYRLYGNQSLSTSFFFFLKIKIVSGHSGFKLLICKPHWQQTDHITDKANNYTKKKDKIETYHKCSKQKWNPISVFISDFYQKFLFRNSYFLA